MSAVRRAFDLAFGATVGALAAVGAVRLVGAVVQLVARVALGRVSL